MEKVNVFKEIKTTSEQAVSKRSRLIVVLLAIFLPFGVHEFYLGRQIKAFGHIAYLLFFTLGPVFIFLHIAYAVYFAYMVSEALNYLLEPDIKDGDGFKMIPIRKLEDSSLRKKIAIFFAFLLPIGVHRALKNYNVKTLWFTRVYTFTIAFVLLGVIITGLFQFGLFLHPIFLLLPVLVSWIDGLRYLLFSK